MTRNIDAKKVKLIEEIASINSETELDKLLKRAKMIRLNAHHINSIFENSEKTISVESLKKNQGFKGINKSEFDRLVEELNVEESIDELLSMID